MVKTIPLGAGAVLRAVVRYLVYLPRGAVLGAGAGAVRKTLEGAGADAGAVQKSEKGAGAGAGAVVATI